MSTTERDTGAEGDLATSTLAEIYAQQGLYERALAIYERLALRAPQDRGVAERIEALKRRIEGSGLPAEASADTEPVEPAEGAPRQDGERGPTEDVEFEAWLKAR